MTETYHHRMVPRNAGVEDELVELLSSHGLKPTKRPELNRDGCIPVDWYDHRKADDPFYDFLIPKWKPPRDGS